MGALERQRDRSGVSARVRPAPAEPPPQVRVGEQPLDGRREAR